MLTTKLKILDEKTGELVEKDFEEKLRRTPKDKDFIVQQQPMLDRLIDTKMTGVDYKVLIALISRCAWANKVSIARKVLAERVGISTTALWRSLNTLKHEGVIYFSPDDRATFYIDPWICWRGEPYKRAAAAGLYSQLFAKEEGFHTPGLELAGESLL